MCVRRQFVRADGRRIVVISSPERWIQHSVQDPDLVRNNMLACMAMCQPGPHTFLMVVPVRSHRGREWAVEGALELLSDAVWRNTMVVFTRPEGLRGSTLEGHVSKHRFLTALVEKCGHGYHLLDTCGRGGRGDVAVSGLLEKVDVMVSENIRAGGVGYLPPAHDVSTITEARRKELEARAVQRQREVEVRRSTLRCLGGER